jgi:hypothetical protein
MIGVVGLGLSGRRRGVGAQRRAHSPKSPPRVGSVTTRHPLPILVGKSSRERNAHVPISCRFVPRLRSGALAVSAAAGTAVPNPLTSPPTGVAT